MKIKLGSICLITLVATVLSAGAAASGESSADLNTFILTPPAPASPRINGPNIFGVRPGSPFLYSIPATGEHRWNLVPNIYPKVLSWIRRRDTSPAR